MPRDTTCNRIFTSSISILKNEIIFVAGLLVSFFVANFHMKVLITLLTEEWNLKLFHAVILTNVQDGAKSISVIFLAIVTDTYIGDCRMLLISAILYSGGLLIWYFTLPKPGEVTMEGNIIYLALLLITVGQCGNEKYIECYDNEVKQRRIQEAAANQEEEMQGRGDSNNGHQVGVTEYKKERIMIRLWMDIYTLPRQAWFWIVILGTAIAIFAIPKGNSKILYLAIILLAASAFFVVGKKSFHLFEGPTKSSLLQVFRLMVAAIRKRHYDTSGGCIYFVDAELDRINQLDSELQNDSEPEHDNNVDHEVNMENSEPVPNISTDELGFLKNAALYKPSTENPTSEYENGRLFTLKQVEDTNRFNKAVRLSLVFLLYGVLTSVGDTFFIYQAFKMNMHINSLEVPIEVIAYGPSVIRAIVSWLCHWVVEHQARAQRKTFYGAVRVGLGMFLSIPCFIIAYRVERMRERRGDISVFWLTPQLFLIGAMNGLAIDGIRHFFEEEMPEHIGRSYGGFFAEVIVGVGQLLGCVWLVLWYSIVAKIEGGSDWFKYDIDYIHLARYYFVMAIYGFISCCIFSVVAIRRYRKAQARRKASALPLETPVPSAA